MGGARLVTMLTDFGVQDAFVASMKAVVLSRAEVDVKLVDISHAIPAQDVQWAALQLASCWQLFPAGTVHLAVVDPGVGSDRRFLLAAADGQYFVAPDNGLLPAALHRAAKLRYVAAERPDLYRQPISQTFHGRDVFAPLAAALLNGVDLASLGVGIDDPVRLADDGAVGPAQEGDGGWQGAIVGFDHFGNAITNLPGPALQSATQVQAAGHSWPVVSHYSQVSAGSFLAIVGSADVVELVCRNASAKDVASLSVGMKVHLMTRH